MVLYKIILFLVFTSGLLFSQENNINLDQKVNGILFTGDESYLILNQGLIRINTNDIYTEYYRQIYDDSTIVNPNTELKSSFDLNIIPFILPSINDEEFLFTESFDLGALLYSNEANNFSLKKSAIELIDSLKSKK